jgi:hypothetical protein
MARKAIGQHYTKKQAVRAMKDIEMKLKRLYFDGYISVKTLDDTVKKLISAVKKI